MAQRACTAHGNVQASTLGDVLVVGVNPDDEIVKYKGPPVMNDDERCALVGAVKWVDEVSCRPVLFRSCRCTQEKPMLHTTLRQMTRLCEVLCECSAFVQRTCSTTKAAVPREHPKLAALLGSTAVLRALPWC